MSAEPLVSPSAAQPVGPEGLCSHLAPRDEAPRPWRWSQVWRDVLFVHWRVGAECIQSQLPLGLELDTWEDQAWVSAVAFRLRNVRMRGFPAIWPVSNLLELNLRTYVRCRGESGIYFLSMHADNRLAIAFARGLTPLPYELAQIEYSQGSRRRFEVSNSRESLFAADFTPVGATREAPVDSLDTWLVERYRAFVPNRRGQLQRMVVEHPPWQLQDATLSASASGLGERWGIDLDQTPDLSHWSNGCTAKLWPFEGLRRYR